MRKKLRYIAITGILYVLFIFGFNFFDTWQIIQRVLNRIRPARTAKVIVIDSFETTEDPKPWPPPPNGGGG